MHVHHAISFMPLSSLRVSLFFGMHNHASARDGAPLASTKLERQGSTAGRQFLFFLPDVILSQHPELDVHLFPAARPEVSVKM